MTADRGLDALRGHQNIDSIMLHGTRVTDAGIGNLATLPRLKKISFGTAGLTTRARARLPS